MSDWLPVKLLREIAKDLPVGKEVHVHHCKSGRNNDRLYVRKNYDGTIVAYCHHCHSRGFVGTRTTPLSVPMLCDKAESGTEAGGSGHDGIAKFYRTDAGVYTRIKERSTSKFEFKPECFSRGATDWLCTGFGITEQEIRDNFIHEEIGKGKVHFPVMYTDGALGLATRNLDPASELKWENVVDRNRTAVIPEDLSKGHTLVIVEDIVSAILVSRHAHAMPLFGSGRKVSRLLEQVTEITRNWDRPTVRIWLDMDNHQVRTSAFKMHGVLTSYYDCDIINTGTDPKNLTEAERVEVLST